MRGNLKLSKVGLLLVIFVGVYQSVVGQISPPYYLIAVKADRYILPILQYNLTDLSPFIDDETLLEHYDVIHETYRKKMNDILHDWREQDPSNSLATESIYEIIRRIEEVPERYRKKAKNYIGGFINHAIYWGCMTPNQNETERLPTGFFLEDLESTFLSFTWFQELFTARAVEAFGSGYVWLVRNRTEEPGLQLAIINTPNEDSPISKDLDPLLALDIWEHAYHRKHQSNRSDYVKNWWMLVDWEAVEAVDRFFLKLRTLKMNVKDEL